MRKLVVIGALGIFASCLYGQGANPAGQTKETWEEINFEFNSSILSDGYPSLLRLADMLKEHPDYRVKVQGHTDFVGSAAYNDKLAQRRADAVKDFLVKYGAPAGQITTSGDGKRSPEVDNRTKEGRFMNRRVVLTVTDASGKVIEEGGISDVLKGLQAKIDEAMKKQEECCAQILKRLDKLDDILAALKALQGDNDRLKGEIADLRNQHNALKDQVAALPKPLNEQQTQTIAHTEAMGALDEAAKRNQKFALLGMNIGPTFGPTRSGGFTFTGAARFFSPFGGDGQRAVQAQGEFMYYPDRKEGQFDIGLVNRWKKVQAGAFASFKGLEMRQYQSAGMLGQASFLMDYLFSRGRIGVFLTRGFKNYAVLNSTTLAPGAFMQTYARVVNQQGVNFLVGAWGDASISGNLAYLKMRELGRDARPGANLKLTQPLMEHLAFTVEGSYNETLTSSAGGGRVVVGLEFGNWVKPKEYAAMTSPVPMDVPRIRYEIGTRRVGNSPPVANAGPDQLGVNAGTITLNGSGSSDPLGLPLTYQWTQIGGPTVTVNGASGVTATFTAAAAQTYNFRLTVTNSEGLSATDAVTISTSSPTSARITSFIANPASISTGQSTTLSWSIDNATAATITPGPGTVDAHTGSVAVSPTQTTTYTLTATGPTGQVTQQVTVTVGSGAGPQILRFEASPLNIQPGQSATLSWTTSGGSTVTLDNGIGTVAANGSTTVSPTATTKYTLTVTSADGRSVTSPITITVTAPGLPQIQTFVASPPTIDAGGSTRLCWQVTGATDISITPGVGSNLSANDCASVSPTQTTTYTLTAKNAAGQIIQANATVSVGQIRILSFTSDPIFSPISGSAVTLSWKTDNALSVVIIGNDFPPQTLPTSGSVVIHPTASATYTLTAYGAGGQTVSTTISVFVR